MCIVCDESGLSSACFVLTRPKNLMYTSTYPKPAHTTPHGMTPTQSTGQRANAPVAVPQLVDRVEGDPHRDEPRVVEKEELVGRVGVEGHDRHLVALWCVVRCWGRVFVSVGGDRVYACVYCGNWCPWMCTRPVCTVFTYVHHPPTHLVLLGGHVRHVRGAESVPVPALVLREVEKWDM